MNPQGESSVRRIENVRRGPSRNWEERAARVAVVAVCLLILSTGIAVAVVLFGSNILKGTLTSETKVGVTGTMLTPYVIGTERVSSFAVVSYTSQTMSVYLEVTLSRTGILPTSVAVRITGNAITGTCVADVCTYDSLGFSVGAGATVPIDVGLTFADAGDFAWTVQAFGA